MKNILSGVAVIVIAAILLNWIGINENGSPRNVSPEAKAQPSNSASETATLSANMPLPAGFWFDTTTVS